MRRASAIPAISRRRCRSAVAVHGLEHLGTTDRGITIFRNQIRKGIRAVKAGSEPVGLFRDAAHSSRPMQRHGRARAAGKDPGAGQEADA